MIKKALIISSILMVAGCATEPVFDSFALSPHYAASGHVGDSQAWVYAQHTLFEGRAGQDYQFITAFGIPIKAEKIGSHYRLPIIEQDFFALQGNHATRFLLAPAVWKFSQTGATFHNTYR